METNSILLIINLILSVVVPVISNIAQTMLNNCKIKRSSCCGGDIETYSPEIKNVNSDNKINDIK